MEVTDLALGATIASPSTRGKAVVKVVHMDERVQWFVGLSGL